MLASILVCAAGCAEQDIDRSSDTADEGGEPGDEAEDPRLICGASPIAVSCGSADGETLVLGTQINRDANADDFDGFTTRHDCTENRFIVNGEDLGPAALIGSLFISNRNGVTIVDHGQADAEVVLETYWKVHLSDEDADATGVSDAKLQISLDGATATGYLVSTDGVYTPIDMLCDS